MGINPDPFIERACQLRIQGMSQQRSWATSWQECRAAGTKTRQECPEVAQHGSLSAADIEAGNFPLPKWPESDSARAQYASLFFKRAEVIDRLHELRQNLRAQELPDAFAYIKVTLQEVIARAMQERPVMTVGGRVKGDGHEWTFNASAAINAAKVYMQAVKMQSEIGEASADHDDIKTLERELQRLRKEIGLGDGPDLQEAVAEGSGNASRAPRH